MHSLKLVVLLSTTASALAGHIHVRDHRELAKRDPGTLSKRIFADRVTWYPTDTGPDACTGKNHGDYDNIVALNVVQWDGGAHCGKSIRITAGGKSAIGVIQDECGSCYVAGQIDLTKGLFQEFYGLDKGEFTADWEFLDGSDSGGSSNGGSDNGGSDNGGSDSKKKTTPKPKPTTTEKKTTTKTTTHHHSTSTSKSSSQSSSDSSTTSSTPAPSSTDADIANVAAAPTTSSSPDIAGGIASDGHGTNGAISAGVNMVLFAGLAAIVALQVL